MKSFSKNSLKGSLVDSIEFYLLAMIIIVGIIVASYYNFLLFHVAAELFCTIIAFVIFVVAWNTKRISQNSYLLFLGIVFLFVGLLDFTHALAYKGMNIFSGYGANLPTQLWIATRYLESISLVIAPFFFLKRIKIEAIFLVYALVACLVLLSTFIWPVFPDSYIEGVGLTSFKKISEYIICIILIFAIFMNYKFRDYFSRSTFNIIIAAMLFTICSEVAFTFYISVYGISNLIGHIFKIISFYLIYKAVIVNMLSRPYENLFREVYESEKEKEKIIKELKSTMKQVKKLEGFIPICASCKKIRDDAGYWNQVEQYLSEHSEAKFSHSICPECVKKLYPDIENE